MLPLPAVQPFFHPFFDVPCVGPPLAVHHYTKPFSSVFSSSLLSLSPVSASVPVSTCPTECRAFLRKLLLLFNSFSKLPFFRSSNGAHPRINLNDRGPLVVRPSSKYTARANFSDFTPGRHRPTHHNQRLSARPFQTRACGLAVTTCTPNFVFPKTRNWRTDGGRSRMMMFFRFSNRSCFFAPPVPAARVKLHFLAGRAAPSLVPVPLKGPFKPCFFFHQLFDGGPCILIPSHHFVFFFFLFWRFCFATHVSSKSQLENPGWACHAESAAARVLPSASIHVPRHQHPSCFVGIQPRQGCRCRPAERALFHHRDFQAPSLPDSNGRPLAPRPLADYRDGPKTGFLTFRPFLVGYRFFRRPIFVSRFLSRYETWSD